MLLSVNYVWARTFFFFVWSFNVSANQRKIFIRIWISVTKSKHSNSSKTENVETNKERKKNIINCNNPSDWKVLWSGVHFWCGVKLTIVQWPIFSGIFRTVTDRHTIIYKRIETVWTNKFVRSANNKRNTLNLYYSIYFSPPETL